MRHLRTLLLAALAASACAPPMQLTADGVVAVDCGDPARPRLRYSDGQVSQLTHCAVKLSNKLNPKIPPVYVNGSPVGFC